MSSASHLATPDQPGQRPGLRGNLTLWVCASLHTVNDAFFAVIFPLLPLLADELRLSYAEVGLVKTLFSFSSSALQLPVGLLAERLGEYALLVGGNAWVAGGLIGLGLAWAYLPLLALSVLAGLGGNTQHPLAATLVARHAPPEQRATAVGLLNFAGDLGKMVAPLIVALVAIPFGWRAALISLGVFGLVYSALIWLAPVGRERPSPRKPEPTTQTPAEPAVANAADDGGWGILYPGRFVALSAVGIVDSSTRGAALAFLPFLLGDKHFGSTEVSWLFTLLFVGGALGKFGCGPLADRFGPIVLIVVTESITAAALGLFPIAPTVVVPLLVAGFGFVLNGTSSVLYASVADLVAEHRRSRGYGLYYSLVTGASAVAPVAYGLLADQAGLTPVFFAMGAVNALTIPLAFMLRRQRRAFAS